MKLIFNLILFILVSSGTYAHELSIKSFSKLRIDTSASIYHCNHNNEISDDQYQYIVFNVTPQDAVLELDGEELSLIDGAAMKYVSFGKHKYRVRLSEYHTEVGEVEISDPHNKKVININLKPAFGWINISGTNVTNGANVYIDDKSVGTIPINTYKLASGQHHIKILQDMYKPFETAVTIEDSKALSITPSFTQNFSIVTLAVADSAEIWINGEKKGISKWSGNLSFGKYLFETKLKDHRNGTLTKTVLSSDYCVSLTLPQPTPIYGSLRIEVEPALSKINIDGKSTGESPLILDKLVIGKHKIEISHNNFWDLDTTIVIKEGQQFTLKGRLIKYSEKYVVAKRNNKFGMVDHDGNTKIDFLYDSISPFVNGTAPCLYKGKWGIIDMVGREKIACEYDKIIRRKDSLSLICKNSLQGIMDCNNRIVIPIIYDTIDAFENGIAKVKKGGFYGYIDKSNNEVIPIKFTYLSEFNNNLAKAQLNGLYGFIDMKGNAIIPFEYGDVGTFSEGYAWVEKDEKYGYVNEKGELVIPLYYDGAKACKNGYFPIQIGSKWGFESLTHQPIRAKYYSVGNFSNGLAPACLKTLCGYINTEGDWVIKPRFETARSFFGNIAVVASNGYYGIINNQGRILVRCDYDNIGLFENGGAISKKNTKKGIIGSDGNIIAPCEYDYLMNFVDENYAYGYKLEDHHYYRISRNGDVSVTDASCGLFTYEPPRFPNGNDSLPLWISANLIYPEPARKRGIQGTVKVQFVIEKDGSAGEVKVVKSLNPLLDKEAVRVIKSMPKWQPAYVCGKLEKSENLVMPIIFKLH